MIQVPERYICRVLSTSQGYGHDSTCISPIGYLATISNQHSSNGMALIEARNELAGEANPFVVNARLATAMTGMMNVLDLVAAYYQDYYKDDTHTGLCCFFGEGKYPFRSIQVEFVQTARTRIESIKFNDENFDGISNGLKRKVPWWGMPSANPDGFNDIIDINGVQLLRDVAANVYNHTTAILKKLADTDIGIQQNFPNI